jgi:hypothetical protein
VTSPLGVFDSLSDKVNLTAKFRVEDGSEEDGVIWIRETVHEIPIHMFRVLERRRWQEEG